MKFSTFIQGNLHQIVAEWETFARTLLPAAKTMSDLALRDHSRDILLAIAKDMETSQSKNERSDKSKHMRTSGAVETAAAAHGALRQIAGFDLTQLVGEFRAMRASVLAMWRRSAAADSDEQAIEEIARFNEGIDQALAESVERYSSDIATFLAVLGHDLRSPLWAIQGSIEILASTNPGAASRSEAMTRIRRSSKAMGALISDLLEYTGAQFGRGITVHRTRCDLGAACEEAIDTAKGIYPKRKFALHLSGDLVIEADAPRMQQVLSNLLNNAVQHGDAEAPVSLTASGERAEVLLRVANLGPPIPVDSLHSIFDPLIQLPAAKSQPHEHPYTGLGMGLFIVREIVNRHHGTVTVASDVETVFTVRLPRVDDQVK
jgi:signal transduction histidine kinase